MKLREIYSGEIPSSFWYALGSVQGRVTNTGDVEFFEIRNGKGLDLSELRKKGRHFATLSGKQRFILLRDGEWARLSGGQKQFDKLLVAAGMEVKT